MFDKVFVEKKYIKSEAVVSILKKIGKDSPIEIDKVENHFGKFYKPYLQKRTNLNLYLGEKKGNIVKEAPPAYGKKDAPHFYFIHAYNCIYECEYCYLQGYFKSPDIVLYLNYQEITSDIENKILSFPENKDIWFHAGEFSDSLALSHLTDELTHYFGLFQKYPQAHLELRTKSSNYKKLLNFTPLENVVISFSLSPREQSKTIDRKTPGLDSRLKAIKALQDHGYKIGIHFDPIMYTSSVYNEYKELLNNIITQNINIDKFEYISLGVVRFSKVAYQEFLKNYPTSSIHKNEFVTGEDQKMRLLKPIRKEILSRVKKLVASYLKNSEKIYICME
jgi:spore photoproduct lyase